MKKLTVKEEELMNIFWSHEKLFIREVLEFMPEPKPHFNTVSTVVRGLEDKNYLDHETHGNSHCYYAKISKGNFKELTLKSVVNKYFGNSIFSAVSALVSNKKLSSEELEELKELVNNVEKGE
ncbi:MAG: BlaI/MecI/CopY family transcriptional regulator [Rikenellaceae bacterium]